MTFLSFDTEDDSKGHPLMVDFYDGEKHHTFFDMLKGWEWLVKQSPAQVWACNAEYDLLNLFGDWTAKVLTLQYVSSGLMRATMLEADVTFYDTLRHWPMSVEAMGKYIGKPKAKDYLSDKVTPKLIKACRIDTEIVYEFTKLMLNRYKGLNLNVKATLPAMAMQYWNNNFNKFDLPRIKESLCDRFREGYYGGRVEVFRFGEIPGPIYHYDVNSLYPYVMAFREYPDITLSSRNSKKISLDKFGMAEVKVNVPETEYPCLPYRSEKEILFPYGKMTGMYCYPELRQLLKDGGTIEKVIWNVEFEKPVSPFTEYVNTCYFNRLQSATDLDRTFWKLMMNSLYGKFAAKNSMLVISRDREKIITTASRFSNVIWSAYVTCYARLVLLDYLRKAGNVYYTDTDSIFTNHDMPVSTDLGGLKLEGIYSKAEFFGNKVYVIDDTYRARGVPRKRKDSDDDPARDFIRTGRCIFRRPARLRESRRSFAQANVWYEAEKNFNAKYTKRKILTNGKTLPLTLDSYLI